MEVSRHAASRGMQFGPSGLQSRHRVSPRRLGRIRKPTISSCARESETSTICKIDEGRGSRSLSRGVAIWTDAASEQFHCPGLDT